jgi:NRAMP (natural resistance-associated macrophage protein)-like metal ion transporter
MFKWIRRTFKELGPGFITGAADDDPAGIATYTQAGASLGYSVLWTALFSAPFMIVVQEMCARIGIVTGQGLGANMRRRFPYAVVLLLVALLFAANTLNLGADLGMMAAATQLVVPLSFPLLVVGMTLITLILQIFTTYQTYAKYLKWLTLSLFAYVFVAFVVDDVQWWTALKNTFLPASFFSRDTLMILVAVLGTTISPYLFFWQASEEVEEQWGEGRMPKKLTPTLRARMMRRLKHMRLDVRMGMVFSNVVAWFIMLLGAAELHRVGIVNVLSADQAAQALAPLAGKFASLVFALGTLGTGLLTVPVLSASAAYAICELLEIPEGLSKKWYQAQAFYGLIVVSTLIGLAGNFVGINPVRGGQCIFININLGS